MDREQKIAIVFERKGGVLDCQKIKHNPYFRLFDFDGVNICSMMTGGEVHFYIIDSYERNACAVYDLQTIVVFKGLLNTIFSISAKIVGEGFFPEVGLVKFQEGRTDPRKLLLKKRDLLNSLSEFSLDPADFPWVDSEDRLGLFLFISNIIFRFVVFHELGHLYNDHGKRSPVKNFLEVDEMDGEFVKGDLDAQARELVADTFAFQKLIEYTRLHLDSMSATPLGRTLKTHVVKDDEDLVAFIAQMVFIYFYMIETPNWAAIDPKEWTHPPAPFRLQTILATLLEHGVIDVPPERMPMLIERAMVLGANMAAIIFGTLADFGWLQVLNQKKYSDHYEKIFEIIPLWISENEDRWPFL